MALASLALRRGTTAPVTADVRSIEGVDGDRQVVWVEVGGETSSGFRGVPLSSTTSAVVQTAADAARSEGMPLVVVMASTGADIVEGIAALEGWGQLAKALVDCSGIVPTIVVVDGPAVSGPALLLGVADLVVMTEDSYGFVNGPVMVEEFTGVRVTTDELGGASELARHTGVPSVVVPTREAALEAIGALLDYLPSSVDAEPPQLADRRSGRPPLPGGRRADPAGVHRQLRRPRGRRGDRRRGQPAGDPRALGGERRHGVRDDRWTADRHRRQPADRAGRHARHPGLAEGRPLRRLLRRLQPADPHARRHPGLLPRQGPGVAGHDPPRRPARLRLRAGHRAPHLRDPAQELRRGVHRDGLQADGQRRLLRLAMGRAGRDGRRAGGGDPPAAGDAGGARRLRGRVRRAPAQPVHRRRAWLHRRRHRARRHAS